MNLDKLTKAVETVCPIHGVCIGNANDKTTWKPDYKLEATEVEKAEAQTIIDSSNLSIIDDIKYVSCRDVILRLNAIGKYETVKAIMSEKQKDEFFSLKDGVDVQDVDVRSLLIACEIDPNTILY